VTLHFTAALAALALLAAGCGSATPYRPMTLQGGYTQSRLGADMVNVVFQGNAYTPWRTAKVYALYRSAELAVEFDFDYFVVVGGNATITPQLLLSGPDGDPSETSGTGPHPMVSIIVRGYRGAKPGPQAFNAREVLKLLGPSIQRE
jgi:hypothetical protein